MDAIFNDRSEDSRDMSLSARDQYEREVSWIEAESLSPEEEKKYFDRLLHARRDPSNCWLQSLAKDARERLTEHYQPLIRRMVFRYDCSLRGVDFLDLVQEANIALLRAFETYDFDFQRPFQGWAIGCIRMALRRFCSDENGFVHLHCEIQQAIRAVDKAEDCFLQMFGRSPSHDELACKLSISSSRLYELLHYRVLQDFSSIEAIGECYEAPEDYCTFAAMYQSFSEEEIACSNAAAVRVEQALAQLLPRPREVICLRYGLCGESSHTEKEVGVLLGTKDGYVNDAAVRAKKRLRVLLAPLFEEVQVAV